MINLFLYLGWIFVGLPLTSLVWIIANWRDLLEDARKGRLSPTPCTLAGELRKTRDNFGSHIRIPLNGLTLHAVALGKSTDPLMLFIHGFPESWYSWRYQMQHFSDKCYCVAITPRGYGESDKPKGVREYDVTKLAADMQGAITSLGKDSAIVVGHDWGGVIAWHVAMIYPDLVSRLVILNAPHPMCYLENLTLSQLLKSYYFVLFQAPFFPEWSFGRNKYKTVASALLKDGLGVRNKEFMTTDDVEIIKYDFSMEGSPHAAFNYYRNLLRYNPALDAIRKRRLQMPVLVLWGKDDMALEPGLNLGLERYCDNVKFVPIDNCSHWAQQDQPQIVNENIAEYLDRFDYVIYGDDSKE